MTLRDSEEQKSSDVNPKIILIICIGLFICSIAILLASLWLFSSPSVISGVVFGFAIAVFLVTPTILLVIYYFKKVRNKESDEERKEKKILVIGSDK